MSETLKLHLTTSATSYKPGDTVIALLQASSGSNLVELQEVELQFAGIERVDTSWVSPAYRKDVSPLNSDKRHLQRYVVFSRLQAATQGTLGGSRDRKFVVRCVLAVPGQPPTPAGLTTKQHPLFLQGEPSLSCSCLVPHPCSTLLPAFRRT
jgi:hypothetical protein